MPPAPSAPAAARSAVLFPAQRSEVPDEEQAHERFGWVAGLVAVCCVPVVVMAAALEPWEPKGVVLFGAIGLGCALAEVSRRRSAATLVVRQGQLAVYRRGARAESFPLGQVTRILRSGRRAARPLAACFLVAVPGVLLLVVDRSRLTPLLAAVAVAFLALGGGGAWSLVRTELQLKSFRIPRGAGTDTVLLTPEDAQRLFGPPPP